MKSNKDHKFLITGGHLTPALAVIQELNNRGFTDIVWVGRKKTMAGDKELSAEYNIIHDEHNIPFIDLTSGKIVRFFDIQTFFEFLINIIKIPIGFIQSFFLLIKNRPSCIVSFGGYVAVPIVIVGKLLGIPSVTHEQTVVSGLANKVIAKFSNKVLLSWGQSKAYVNAKKIIVTGNPIRQEVLQVSTNAFSVNEKLPTVYITGGNQGAHIINAAVGPIIEDILKSANVIHQTGLTSITRDYEKFDRLSKSLIGKTKGTYIVKGNIFGPEIGEVFDKADVLVSRSGANIVNEILALGKSSILIPIPWSINNEQLRNAEMVKKYGLAEIIEEKDLTPKVLKEQLTLGIKNAKKGKSFTGKSLKNILKDTRELVRIDAAKRIVDEILLILN